MNSETSEVLKTVCCDVFEQLAFMFGEEIDKEDIESDSNKFMKAQMSYKGEREGEIDIVLPSELADALAINILGLDEDDAIDSGASTDALKELLNTICGRMMTSLYGEEAVFDLSVPKTDELDNEQWQAVINDKEYLAIDMEDNPVLIYFTD